MNLLLDLPSWDVRRQKGEYERIFPWEITRDHATNPVVDFYTNRMDFNGMLFQRAIALFQQIMAPDMLGNERRKLFLEPPPPETLRQWFIDSGITEAFNLDGRHRFMQDQDELEEQEPKPITALLLDTMGSATHFVKNHSPDDGFCPACAAVALDTYQTNGPPAGRGYRTGLRGGGPLTTVILYEPRKPDKDPPASLWRSICLNVLEKSQLENNEKNELRDIFPWLAPTRTSEPGTGKDTTYVDVHPLQMFWGMPSRIRLDMENRREGYCAICNRQDALITRMRVKAYGINYAGDWPHPLTPYTRDNKGQNLPMHPKAGGIQYRHWLGLVQRNEEIKREPARVVRQFMDKGFNRLGKLKIRAFGYELSNVKPIAWHEATLPLHYLPDNERRKDFDKDVENLVEAATEMLKNLKNCLKKAWFSEGSTVRGDTSFVDLEFWQQTDSTFYQILDALHRHYQDESADAQPLKLYHQWFHELYRYTEQVFDRLTDMTQIGDLKTQERVIKARLDLQHYHYKKRIKDLLRLPKKPQPKRNQ